MVGPLGPSRKVCSWARAGDGWKARLPQTKTPKSAPPIRIGASLIKRSLRGERALRNLTPRPRTCAIVALTGRHAGLAEALAKLIAARLRVRMHRAVAGDVEHRANVVKRLVVQPALTPRPPHSVAIGRCLARAVQDMPAFVIVDQPLHLPR